MCLLYELLWPDQATTKILVTADLSYVIYYDQYVQINILVHLDLYARSEACIFPIASNSCE